MRFKNRNLNRSPKGATCYSANPIIQSAQPISAFSRTDEQYFVDAVSIRPVYFLSKIPWPISKHCLGERWLTGFSGFFLVQHLAVCLLQVQCGSAADLGSLLRGRHVLRRTRARGSVPRARSPSSIFQDTIPRRRRCNAQAYWPFWAATRLRTAWLERATTINDRSRIAQQSPLTLSRRAAVVRADNVRVRVWPGGNMWRWGNRPRRRLCENRKF